MPFWDKGGRLNDLPEHRLYFPITEDEELVTAFPGSMRLLTGRWFAPVLCFFLRITNVLFPNAGAKARQVFTSSPGLKAGAPTLRRKRQGIAYQGWTLRQGVAIGFLFCLLPLAAVGQTVTVNDSFFSSNAITITAGQTVTWSWAGGGTTSLAHNVVSGSSCSPDFIFNSGATKTSGTFGHTFTAAGTYNYYCDPHCGFMTGSVTVNPAAATHLVLSGVPGSATAGVAFNVTVTAFDQFGNVATGFGNTVSFTSSDGAATLPSNTLINGSRVFSITLRTAGSRSLTANASGVSSSGTAFINVSPAATSTFTVVPSANPVTAGASFNVTVTAKDAFGNTTPSYGGTVHLTSVTDPSATLPGNNTLVSGARTFTGVILRTAGTETVTATDTLSSSITGTSNGITVNPGPAHHFSVSAPPGAFVGLPFNITVTALDQFDNQATTSGTAYTGTVHFTSSDGGAVLPADYTFVTGDNGAHNFSITLNSIGSQTVTATDTVTSSIQGSAVVSVRPPCPAASRTFSNPTQVNFSTNGTTATTSLYPSPITVSGMTGTIGKLTLTLSGYSDTNCAADLALLLQGPHGQFVIPYSLVGPCSAATNNVTLTLDDSAATPLPQFPNPLNSGTYRPSSYVVSAFSTQPIFQAPAPGGPTYTATQLVANDGTATFANVFNGTDPNGTWNLYVLYQPQLGPGVDSGKFTGGWSLNITPQFAFTNSTAIAIPNSGHGANYPSKITVAGLPGHVTKVTVTLNSFTSVCQADPAFLLVGPQGQNLVLESESGGCTSSSANVPFITLDDAVSAQLPAFSFATPNFAAGLYRPTSNKKSVSGTAPTFSGVAGPYTEPVPDGSATLASVFNGIDGNGDWNLYAITQFNAGASSLDTGWTLNIETDCPAGTNCAASSDFNPSVFGQPVIITGAVSSGSGTPFSPPPLNFLDGISNFGIRNLDGSGQTTETDSTFSIGSHPITVNYPGNITFASCTSAVLNQVVDKADTTTIVTNPMNPSVFGQLVTFTATVNVNSPGAGTPTGTVNFFDGVTPLGPGTLSGGVATLSTAGLAVGSHSITAVYGGDATFNGSTSGVFTQTVNQGGTITTVGTSGTPSIFGTSVTFTANVSVNSPGAGTPTGTVTFNDNGVPIGGGTVALSGTTATFPTSALSVGSHPITATYNGDTDFSGSTSGPIDQNVNKGTTTSSVATNGSPSIFGNSVTFTATIVVATGAGTPTGTVTFMDGVSTLGTGALNGAGHATFSTAALAVGAHSITAVYAGDGSFVGSTSGSITQNVSQGTTTTGVGTSGSPSILGTSVTFTATITVATGAGTPTGTVTFKDGAATLGTGAVSGGTATFSTSNLSVASHSITAVYGGDGNFTGSTSASITQMVSKGTPTVSLGSSANPSLLGNSVTFTATLGQLGGVFPTGSVLFLDGAAKLGSGTLNGSGVATFSTSALALGSHPMTASYAGDSSFLGNTSPVVPQQVNPKTSTTTVVVSSLNPSSFRQYVTLTATVTSTGTPTGTVTFWDGARQMGTAPLNGGGIATYTTNQWTIGNHQVTAAYGGDFNFAISNSTVLVQRRSPKPH